MQLMRIAFLTLTILITGCASTAAVREYLDEDSAATITVGAGSWVFARERPDLAVNAQDYITVTPTQVNRAGTRILYLYCQLWSTIDRRGEKAIVPADAELALLADDRRVPLPKSPSDIRKLGFGSPPVPLPNKSAQVRAAVLDASLMRSIANADQVRIALNNDGVTEYFVTWRNGRQSLLEFLKQVDRVQGQ